MIALHYKKRTYAIPQGWNELTPAQFIGCAKVLASSLSTDHVLLSIFRLLSGMKAHTFFTMPPELTINCLDVIEWVYQKVTLSSQLIPRFRGYYGPAKDLENLKSKEFALTEAHFLAYRNSDDMESLNELVAILYRPAKKKYDRRKNPDGDIRMEYNPHLTPYYKKTISKWPRHIKCAIALYYEGCRNNFFDQYREVFEQDGKGGEIPPYGMWNIMRDVAEKGVYGDMDKVEEQYVDTLLMELHTVIIKTQEYEKLLKSKT
jgi:hypothetical protein